MSVQISQIFPIAKKFTNSMEFFIVSIVNLAIWLHKKANVWKMLFIVRLIKIKYALNAYRDIFLIKTNV
jgi:hypothetical protein